VKTSSPARPADQLRALGAPRELVEWVRKLPTDTAARAAWVDAPRADWLPYLAVLRGLSHDAILRATCECAVENAGTPDGEPTARVLAVLRDACARGRDALAPVERELADLRAELIAYGANTRPGARPPWMFWAELVFELQRATSRGNALVGIALAMRMLATADKRGKHGELVARLREKLTLSTG
jgi:hypothetical protein